MKMVSAQRTVAIVALACIFAVCTSHMEVVKKQYGLFESAVRYSTDKVYGEYDDSIPDTFDNVMFLSVVKGKIPDEYYKSLQSYNLVVEPRRTYYLLKAYDKCTGQFILFDFSCTPGIDGPILLYPNEYNTDNIEQYNTCK